MDAAPQVTFNRDIAPILWANCGSCHRPGQIAPFSLITYRDAAPRARQILAAVKTRQMPPWLPESAAGQFIGARHVADGDVARLEAWVRAGAPEGSPADLPSMPAWHDGWQLGTPDLVVEAAEPYTVPAGTEDTFRNLVIAVPIDRTRYVRGIEIDPGNRRVVHHIALAIDRTPASRRLDASDPGPGFSGAMFADSARSPESRALGWTPGMTPALEPQGMAWQLHKGSDIVLLLHLMPPAAGAESVRPKVAFYFTDTPPSRVPVDFKLGSKAIDIPAGAPGYAIEDRYTLPVDADLLSIYPHAHYLAKEMRVTATMPDGRTADLLTIRNWDFHWQDQYRYREPIALPRGTTIAMRYVYDNSAANRHNPRRAPVRVRFGPLSSDEMGDLWLRLLPHTAADANVLARSYREHEVANDLAQAEAMVRAEPTDAAWRNRLGAALIESGRPADAVAPLAEAVRIEPGNAEAHNNLGHALQMQGKTSLALPHFRDAARLAPDNDLVHLNLANALDELGDTAAALPEFEHALALNPGAADAHNNYGVALGSAGRIADAIAQFEAALAIDPGYEDAKNNLAVAMQLRSR